MQTSVSGSRLTERQRDAELVVVARLGRDVFRRSLADRGEDVLCRSLPRRAGDRDDCRPASVAHRPAERRESGERVVGHERRRGASRQRVVDVRVAGA